MAEGNEGDNSCSDSVIINPPPNFTKVCSPDAISTGGNSTLTFTIDNSTSTLATTSLDFTDNLPTGLIVATPANAFTTCTGGTLTAISSSSLITYSGGSVAAGASCTISVDMTATVPGNLVNTTGNLTSSLGNSGTATDNITIEAVDLQISKDDGGVTVRPGELIVYTLIYTNVVI